jgi:hypothetical protein
MEVENLLRPGRSGARCATDEEQLLPRESRDLFLLFDPGARHTILVNERTGRGDHW